MSILFSAHRRLVFGYRACMQTKRALPMSRRKGGWRRWGGRAQGTDWILCNFRKHVLIWWNRFWRSILQCPLSCLCVPFGWRCVYIYDSSKVWTGFPKWFEMGAHFQKAALKPLTRSRWTSPNISKPLQQSASLAIQQQLPMFVTETFYRAKETNI